MPIKGLQCANIEKFIAFFEGYHISCGKIARQRQVIGSALRQRWLQRHLCESEAPEL